MNGLTLEQLVADMNDENSVEKTASEKVGHDEDTTQKLLNTLKGRVEEDMKDAILEKKASKAADIFSELAMQKIAGDEFIEKVAEAVANKLIEKLAVDTDSQVVHDFSDPVPSADPQTSVEAESKKTDPKAAKAQAAKEKILNKEMVEGVASSGAQGEKVAMDDALMQKILAALAEDE